MKKQVVGCGCCLDNGVMGLAGVGYTRMRDPATKKTVAGHVYYYEQKYGPVPKGLMLDHMVCQNPGCVNPDHVEPVTNAVNQQRGRRAKLTPEGVAKIKRLRRLQLAGQREVARMFGVDKRVIMLIERGLSWANIPEEVV